MQNLMEKAIAEAYASCKTDMGVVLFTLELYHTNLRESSRAVRWPISSNEPQYMKLGLEDNAPNDAGKVVDFLCLPFEVTIPAQEENAPGEFNIVIENVGSSLTEAMRAAVAGRDTVKMIFREYLQGMPEKPQVVYSDFSISKVSVSAGKVEATASMLDWLLRPYGKLYTPTEFPGLVRGR